MAGILQASQEKEKYAVCILRTQKTVVKFNTQKQAHLLLHEMRHPTLLPPEYKQQSPPSARQSETQAGTQARASAIRTLQLGQAQRHV